MLEKVEVEPLDAHPDGAPAPPPPTVIGKAETDKGMVPPELTQVLKPPAPPAP